MENLDDLDAVVVLQLGYAVARAQLLEFAMVKLLEAQHYDVERPLDERWDEISGWLKLTAGRLAGKLGVPSSVAQDLRALVQRRNRVAHESWTDYVTARGAAQGDAAAEDWAQWLATQAALLGRG